MKGVADIYTTEVAPVNTARETFNTERSGHKALIDAAGDARTALNSALLADAGYQTAKTALDAAVADAGYQAAKTAYENQNLSENFAALSRAKGEYVV